MSLLAVGMQINKQRGTHVRLSVLLMVSVLHGRSSSNGELCLGSLLPGGVARSARVLAGFGLRGRGYPQGSFAVDETVRDELINNI